MNHDRAVVKTPSPDDFNFGFVSIDQGVRSLMAYNDSCAASKKSCRRLLVFSSPHIMARGVALGRSFTEAGGAYNTEILCRAAPVISKFR